MQSFEHKGDQKSIFYILLPTLFWPRISEIGALFSCPRIVTVDGWRVATCHPATRWQDEILPDNDHLAVAGTLLVPQFSQSGANRSIRNATVKARAACWMEKASSATSISPRCVVLIFDTRGAYHSCAWCSHYYILWEKVHLFRNNLVKHWSDVEKQVQIGRKQRISCSQPFHIAGHQQCLQKFGGSPRSPILCSRHFHSKCTGYWPRLEFTSVLILICQCVGSNQRKCTNKNVDGPGFASHGSKFLLCSVLAVLVPVQIIIE